MSRDAEQRRAFELKKAAARWNAYYHSIGLSQYATAVATNGKLHLPHIPGRKPNHAEHVRGLELMMANDFYMVDVENPSHFRVDEESGMAMLVNFDRVVSRNAHLNLGENDYRTDESQYNAYKGSVESAVRRYEQRAPRSRSSSPIDSFHTVDNVKFLQALCAKAQTKVHNRFFSLGFSGTRVHVGKNSYVVPGHLASTINSISKEDMGLAPDAFKQLLLRRLTQHAETKVKCGTSRDVWTHKLYGGLAEVGGNASAFFDDIIADDGAKKAYKEPSDSESAALLP